MMTKLMLKNNRGETINRKMKRKKKRKRKKKYRENQAGS